MCEFVWEIYAITPLSSGTTHTPLKHTAISSNNTLFPNPINEHFLLIKTYITYILNILIIQVAAGGGTLETVFSPHLQKAGPRGPRYIKEKRRGERDNTMCVLCAVCCVLCAV
jgi:hypothetical protein